jgi:hypothetical protein
MYGLVADLVAVSEIAVVLVRDWTAVADKVSWLNVAALVSATNFSQEMCPSSRRVVTSTLTQFNLQSTQIHKAQAT